jgi:hypothetical protein
MLLHCHRPGCPYGNEQYCYGEHSRCTNKNVQSWTRRVLFKSTGSRHEDTVAFVIVHVAAAATLFW